MIAAVTRDNSSAQICLNIESFHLIHVGVLWFYANFMMMEFNTMTLVGDLYELVERMCTSQWCCKLPACRIACIVVTRVQYVAFEGFKLHGSL
jgi:hypothetical protein